MIRRDKSHGLNDAQKLRLLRKQLRDRLSRPHKQLPANEASIKRVVSSHGHLPVTRRDFAALGIGGASILSANLWTPSALADRIQALGKPSQEIPAAIVFDLVGGAALSGNFLVTDQGGELLPSYDTLGFDPRRSNVDTRFGLPAPRNTSRFFEGMIAAMSTEAQARTKLAALCHQSQDDTAIGRHSGLTLFARAQELIAGGSKTGLALRGTASGGRTRLAMDFPLLQAKHIGDLSQLELLLGGLTALSQAGLSDSDIAQIKALQRTLYEEQALRLDGNDTQGVGYQQIRHSLARYQSAQRAPIDPRQDLAAREVFGLSEDASPSDQTSLIAAIALGCAKGTLGASSIALDGYDYHDRTQTTGDAKDFEAGQTVGRCIELAHRNSKPLFLQVISDGSCAARSGSREWIADSGERSLTLIGIYDPERRVELVRNQVGYFTSGQIAEGATYIGRNTRAVGYAALVNYLALANQPHETLRQIINSFELPDERVAEVTCFS